jgi:hypothetical protein
MPQVRQRGVEVQHLKNEQVQRLDGIKLPASPHVPRLTAGVQHHGVGKELLKIALDPLQDGGDSGSHPWPPVGWWRKHLPV